MTKRFLILYCIEESTFGWRLRTTLILTDKFWGAQADPGRPGGHGPPRKPLKRTVAPLKTSGLLSSTSFVQKVFDSEICS